MPSRDWLVGLPLIGVHLAMLLIMVGGTLSATGSFKGSVTVPQGLNFLMADVLSPGGFLSTPTEAFNTEVRVNKFSLDYYDSGEELRKTISVNDPWRYGGITIYQTDWSFSALQILKDDEGSFDLAMAPLQINGDKKLYGTFLQVGGTDSSKVKDLCLLVINNPLSCMIKKENLWVFDVLTLIFQLKLMVRKL